MSEIRDGKDPWKWFRLFKSLNAFRRSSILQKQFIIVIISLLFLVLLRKLFHTIFSSNHLTFLCASSSFLSHFLVTWKFCTLSVTNGYQTLNDAKGFIAYPWDLSLVVPLRILPFLLQDSLECLQTYTIHSKLWEKQLLNINCLFLLQNFTFLLHFLKNLFHLKPSFRLLLSFNYLLIFTATVII